MKKIILLLLLLSISDLIIAANKNGGGGGQTIQAMSGLTFSRAGNTEWFANYVSSAGDVNGDGYDDFIMTAPMYDYGSNTDAGRVYIYFGGTIINTVPDVIITNTAPSSTNDFFGFGASGAGDVNGDGYDDIIVGVPGKSINGLTDNGMVSIYYGGSPMNTTADVVIYGTQTSESIGYVVAGAGDVNGDGYSDVLIGSYLYDIAHGDNKGKVILLYGGSNMDNIADKTFNGSNNNEYFGSSAASAGDVNGDGYGDIIVGADSYNSNMGRAVVFLGGANMDTTPDHNLTYDEIQDGDRFGASVACAGDLNGDGLSDVIVGVPESDYNHTDAGAACIFFGGSDLNLNTEFIPWDNENELFGYSVSTAGDINGDGYDDILIGSPGYGESNLNAGNAYVYFGGNNIDNNFDVVFEGEGIQRYYGHVVACAGDVNADGYKDILISNFNDSEAYLYTNKLTGKDIYDMAFAGLYINDQFGSSVANAGDVNGDGYDDLIVGAAYDDQIAQNVGCAYIFYGGNIIDKNPDVVLFGQSIGDLFGSCVAGAGDVNGDGYDDVIVGADNVGSSDQGAFYIYYGGSSMDNTADFTYLNDNTNSNENLGISVSTAGDINGDGFADVIIGAPFKTAGNGRALIFFGGSIISSTPDVVLSGYNAYDYFGHSVACAGDVNGDGFTDVIVGAYGYDTPGDEAGAAYLYYGGSTVNTSPEKIFSADSGYNYFGRSVASAGDVNGDGFSDVIIGAPRYEGFDGKVYLYLGGLDMDTDADWELHRPGIGNEQFGARVGSAGDINGDGYSDFMASWWNDPDQVQIFFGGLTLNTDPDVILYEVNSSSGFGNSIASAGDMNNDGLDDIIVGTSGDDNAYLYLSSAPSSVPRIMWIKDVTNDEGGFLKVRWTRSALDSREAHTITSYEVQRSDPAYGGNFAWQTIATITPTQDFQYQYNASTPSDSMSGNNGTYFFRVLARNSTGELWKSNIVSGYSVDNLAPDAPKGTSAERSGYNVVLTWDENTESDLKQYLIYRNSSSPLPEDAVPIGTTTDLTYTDTSPLEEMVYYFIKAEDIHANKSTAAETNLDVYLGTNVKVFLQGCYSSGSMTTTLNSSGYIPLFQPYNTSPWNYTGTESVASIPSGVVDWVLVELRSDLTTVAGKRAGFLKSDGTITDTDGTSQLKFSGLNSGNYYVVIRHRNHLAVMTASAIALTNNSGKFDFSTAQTQAYGTNAMKDMGGGVYGMIAGDANGNGTIKYNLAGNDRALIYSRIGGGNINATVNGYYNEDINMNGVVKYNLAGNDRAIIYQSIGSGSINLTVSSQVPTDKDGNKPRFTREN